MSLFVNTNVSSLNAQRQLFNSSNAISKSFEQLSSGFRINGAADDAAGLQISDRLTSQLQGLNQAVRNANDGISLVQTADGALNETSTNLQRLRQLAIQAQNGINNAADKEAIQKEADELLNEINRISDDSQFAGRKILDGTFSSSFLVGANGGQTIGVSLTQFSGIGFGTQGLGVQGLDVASGTVSRGSPIDVTGASALNTGEVFLSSAGGVTDGGTYSFAVSGDGGNTYTEFSATYDSSLMSQTGFITNLQVEIENAVGGSYNFSVSVGANLSLSSPYSGFRIAALDTNPTNLDLSGKMGSYSISPSESETSILDGIDGALSRVNGVRADLGATQNQFQSTIRNLSNISENLSSSRSQIMDTDFASATAVLAKNQIIQQASTSILAQANQRPQAALSLLG